MTATVWTFETFFFFLIPMLAGSFMFFYFLFMLAIPTARRDFQQWLYERKMYKE